MNSFIKVFVIILIFRGSTAITLSSLPTDVIPADVNSLTDAVPSSITTLIKAASQLSISDLNMLNIRNGILDLDAVIQKLNLPNTVDIVSLMNFVNVPVVDGQLDLKSLFQDFSLTNINYSDVRKFLNAHFSDAVQELTSLAENIKAKLTEYFNSLNVNESEDGRLDFMGLAQKYVGEFGSVKEYSVITEDDYILTVYRITNNECQGDVALLSHGFFCSSDDFILRGNTSLIYMLVQNCYDVWAINYRGNRYSRGHTTLNPDTHVAYWDFSMHEYGYFDLSAVIDLALHITGTEQLSVIGHSEGTAAVFVLTSTRPEYNKKINKFVALSPVCYLSNSGWLVTTLVRLGPAVNAVLLASGIEELLRYGSFSRNVIQTVCSQDTWGYNLCLNVFGAMYGYNDNSLEPEFFLTMLGHFLAGSSRKNLEHYLQIGYYNRFATYDNWYSNKGPITAPKYDFKKVTCKVSLFVASNDQILGLEDAKRVGKQLSNIVVYHVVDDKKFNHMDFIWGRNAYNVLYPYVLNELN